MKFKEFSNFLCLVKVMQMRSCGAVVLAPLLAACSYTMNQNSSIGSVVQSVPLENGQSLSVGYQLPETAAGCNLVNQTTRNWAIAQSVGGLKFGGGRQVLRDEAVTSVNQRPRAGINYVALIIPNEADISIINVTAGRDATTSYFRCVSPPQPK